MKSIAQKKPLRKYLVRYELGDPDWGFMTQHEAETMAVSEARARSNIMYRAAMDQVIRIVEVREIG